MKRFVVDAVLVGMLLLGGEAAGADDQLPAAEPVLKAGWRMGAYAGVSTVNSDETLTRQLGLPEGVGLVVQYVDAASPAAGKLQVHDIVHRMDDQVLVEHRQLAVLMRMRKAGDTVRFSLLRAGEPLDVEVMLGEKELPPLSARMSAHPGFPGAGTSNGAWHGSPDVRERIQAMLKQHMEQMQGGSVSNAFLPPGIRLPPMPPGLQQSGVRIRLGSPSQSSVSVLQSNGWYTLIMDETGKKFITATTPDGHELVRRPVDADGNAAGIPPEVVERLMDLERFRAELVPQPAPQEEEEAPF